MKFITLLLITFFSAAAFGGPKPIAKISVNPLGVFLPSTLSLSGAGSTSPNGTIVSYQWSFGDGSTGEGKDVSHYYSSKKVENIRLTVVDSQGQKDSVNYVYTFADDNTAPVLSFDVPSDFTSRIDTPIITAFFSDTNSKVRPDTVRFVLDSEDVTSKVVIADNHAVLQFTAEWPLAPGVHTLVVMVKDYYNNKVTGTVKIRYKADQITRNFLNGQVVDKDGLPLAGVNILSISGPVGSILSGTTDQNGKYSIPFNVGGEYTFRFSKLGFIETLKSKALIAGFDDVIGSTFLEVADSKSTLIAASTGGVASNTSGSISLTIPPGALLDNTNISITEATTGKTLSVPLPNGSQFTYAQTLQPLGLTFSQPVVMTLNNVLGFPPGFEIPVGLSNLAMGIWTDSGYKGVVTEDGSKIELLFTNVAPGFKDSLNFSRQDIGPGDINLNVTNRPGETNNPPDPAIRSTLGDPCHECETKIHGSRINVNSNKLGIDYSLPEVMRKGEKFNLTLSYSSTSVDPYLILAATTVIKEEEWDKGRTSESVTQVSSQAVDFTPPVTYYPAVKTSEYMTIIPAKNSEGKYLDSGSYPYFVEFHAVHNNMVYATTDDFGGFAGEPTPIPTREPVLLQAGAYGRSTVDNQKNSVYGAGWNIQGAEKLVVGPDKVVTFFDGSGDFRTYLPTGVSAGSIVTQKNVTGGVDNLLYHKGQIYGADCESDQVFRIDGKGRITTIAGGSNEKVVELRCPKNIFPSRKGGYYVSDYGNGRVVYIRPDKTIKVVADSSKGVHAPSYVAEDNVLAVYYIDGKEIKRISTYDGSIKTLVGESEDAIYKYKLLEPSQIHFDEYHNLIVTDAGLGQIIKFYVVGHATRVMFDGIKGVKGLAFDPVLKRFFAISKDGSLYHWDGLGTKRLHSLDLVNGLPELATSSSRKGPKVSAIAYSPEVGLVTSTPSGIVMKSLNTSKDVTTDVNYISSISDFSKLVRKSNGTFIRTLVDKTIVTYDGIGRITARTLPNGTTTSYEYGHGGLRRINIPGGGFYDLRYGNIGYLDSIIDPAGRVTKFAYNNLGQLISITNPENQSWGFTYDSNDLMTSKTDERDQVTSYNYLYGRVTRITYPGQRVKVFQNTALTHAAYSPPSGDLVHPLPSEDVATIITSPENNTEIYLLDKYGTHDGFIDGEGNRTSYRKNDSGFVIESSTQEGRKAYYDYDILGRMIKSIDQMGTNNIGYDPASNKVSFVKDSFNNQENYFYDSQGNLTNFYNKRGMQTLFNYNTDGTLSSVKDSLNNEVFISRDAAGNPTSIKDAIGNVTELERDLAGNIVATQDPLGFRTVFDYDGLNRLIKSTDAKGGETLLTYLPTGEVESVTDAKSNHTSFGYDVAGNMTKLTNPSGRETLYSFDKNKRLRTKTTKAGVAINYSYDRNDQLTGIAYTGEAKIFKYDGDGLLVKVTDSDSEVTRDYDNFGRLNVEKIANRSSKVTYQYDATGGISRIKLYSHGRDIIDLRKSFHQTGELYKMSGFVLSKNFEFTRDIDNLNRLSSINFPNGSSESFVYDQNSRVSKIIVSNSIPQFTQDYTYDSNGNIPVIQESFNGQKNYYRYKYDELNRLSEEDTFERRVFNLDAVGNDTSRGGQYNELNQLVEDVEFTFKYDLNGNRIRKTSKLTGDIFEYSFTQENELSWLKIYKAGNLSKTITYQYDGLGRRIQRAVQNHANASQSYTWNYVYDGSNLFAIFDGQDNLLSAFIHGEGIDDPVLIVTDTNGDGEMDVLSVVKDHLNSTKLVLDEDRKILQSVSYSAYGETRIQSNGQQARKFVNPFYFTSRELEPESGEYYYRARYYDPYSQKFLSEDPLGFLSDGANFYRYAFNKPLKYVDPSGLKIDYGCEKSRLFFEDKVRKLRNTKKGDDLISKLEKDPTIYKIHLITSGHSGQDGNNIYINPNEDRKIETSDGYRTASVERVLAHELGHLENPASSEMENINNWENPVMSPTDGLTRISHY